MSKPQEVSISPTGEQFPLPAKEEYAAEYARLEKLAAAARKEGKEVVVVEEYQKGYQLHDRVLRTAKVKVGPGPQDEKKGE